jgi:diguanylate cyclase (GGDEF)-like protein
MAGTVAFAFALFGLLLLGAGFLLGSRFGHSREQALKDSLDERDQKLSLAETELLRNAAIDPTTGLHTQQHFQEFLEREWRRSARERQWVSAIMVEVDHFRGLTERQGRTAGEACLNAVAGALKPLIHRAGDVIARHGGSGKFGIVLGNTDAKGALQLAERLRSAVEGLKMPNPVSPSKIVTATVGVATAMPDREGAWQEIELIAAAERALARAREQGRNTVASDSPAGPVTSAAPRG